MPDTNQSWNEKANALKTQASEKLDELKEKAGELADSVKEKAGQAWDKLNSPETKAQLEHLKDQAVEKLNEAEVSLEHLGVKAREMWNKATHHEQTTGNAASSPDTGAPTTGAAEHSSPNPGHPADEHHDDPSKD
jgi:hypothetical protein